MENRIDELNSALDTLDEKKFPATDALKKINKQFAKDKRVRVSYPTNISIFIAANTQPDLKKVREEILKMDVDVPLMDAAKVGHLMKKERGELPEEGKALYVSSIELDSDDDEDDPIEEYMFEISIRPPK